MTIYLIKITDTGKLQHSVPKSVALLYTNNKQTGKGIRETIPFTRVSNDIKYFETALAKQVKHLYDKNFKILKKDIEDIIRWKELPCS